MDVKKLAIAIVILGILVGGYGIIKSLTGGPKAMDDGSLTSALDRNEAREIREEMGQTNRPYILIGMGIILLGVIIRIAANKPKSTVSK